MKNNIKNNVPDQAILLSLFDFDLGTGILKWKPREKSDFACLRGYSVFKKLYEGQEAGCKNTVGYTVIYVSGKLYMRHRLLWVIAYGEISPDADIDHIDGNPSNDSICNLRLVTHKENGKNLKVRKNNKSGMNGVYWCNTRVKWAASCTIDGVNKFLGYYHKKSDAFKASAFFREKNGFSQRHVMPSSLRSP